MKLRYWLIIIVLYFIIGVVAILSIPISEYYTNVDMVQINERYKNVIQDLNSKQYDVSELEQQNNCNIYLKSDDDYDTQVNNAIKNQGIILDYNIIQNGEEKLAGKIVFSEQQKKIEDVYVRLSKRIATIFIIGFSLLIIMLMIFYHQYVRPFKKLQKFAGQISKGNFEFPLEMRKHNYFGAFTESFDVMREELKRARQGEYEANQSKKELVASLSHDIKTPVSTIKAICELLEIKVTSEMEKEKINIIEQKADVIDHLISDMFHATLEDLEQLKISPTEELSTIIRPMFDDINHYGKIHFETDVPECMIYVDKIRLNQVIDNLINNSYKYANTDIYVKFRKSGQALEIQIRDGGPGIDDDELPLVYEKFYRGSNSKGKDGSGLGLYLSKKFMEGMGGNIAIENRDGFVVTLNIALA